VGYYPHQFGQGKENRGFVVFMQQLDQEGCN